MKRVVEKFSLVSIIFVLISCSSSTVIKNENDLIIYPAPPEPTKIQYLTSFSTSSDVTGEESGLVEYVAGETQRADIIKPYGIAIYKGKLYVCDTILGGLEILDFVDKSFQYFQPKGFGQFKKPINCFKDNIGRLFVADAERAQIVVFDSLDNYLTAFGEDVLKKPTDVFVTDSLIYVSDLKGRDIEVFSHSDYSWVKSLPDENLGEKERVFQPTNIYVKQGRLYVSDFGDFRIKIYSTEGEFIDSVGSYGTGLGQFVRPKGIAVDDSLNLFVVDAGFENVQIFDKDGNLLMFFGGPYVKPGDMWLPAKVIIDYDNLKYFQKYVYEGFDLKYLIFVTNQYGPEKINVYGFVDEKK
ncbi:NHL repeat protein [bacterium BMS3Abin03]|nr:NHL repeat protein [bacterium BMS3Abin03]